MAGKPQMELFEGVGDRIAALLRRHPTIGSQTALARAASVSRQTLHRAINQDTMTRDTARSIAAVLDVSLDDLLHEARTTAAPVEYFPTSLTGDGSESPAFLRPIQQRVLGVEFELFHMGATMEEMRGFAASLRGNPVLIGVFSGGAPERMTEAEMNQLFTAAASGYKRIVKTLIANRDRAARSR